MKLSTVMILFLLAVMASCGKDNKSGKGNDNFPYFNQLGTSGVYTGTSIVYNGLSLAQVINENPCVGGYNNNARFRISTQAAVNTVISNGDVWIGVTSFGDVAAIGGTAQGPIFEAYLCPRSAMPSPQSIASGIQLLPYTGCGFKQMNATLPGGDGVPIRFRAMDFGTSAGGKFSYCR